MHHFLSCSKRASRLLQHNLKLSRALTIVLILFVLYISLFRHHDSLQLSSSQCPQDPITDRIVVAVKTGATEASEKIPALMQTSLRCAKTVLFFSDMEQDIGVYHLHDALETIAPEVKQKDSAFEFYKKQQAAWQRDGSVSAVKGMRDPAAANPNDLAAWTLDKYKNLHILEKTWELAPDRDWYILIDADTYLIWANLLRWLPSLDSTKKVFFGSRVYLSGIPFAHGGSGTIFTRSLMYDLAVTHKGTAARWDPEIRNNCCGDFVLGKALKEYGNQLVSIRPEISGQKPSSMPFGSNYWCQPTFTLHHFSAPDMRQLDAYERARLNQSIPLTHAEIYANLVKDPLQAMPAIREDWDNISWRIEMGSGLSNGEDERPKAQSAEECAKACEANTQCLQFVFDSEQCYLGKAFRLGEKRAPENGKRWRSGWNQARIAEWVAKQEVCNDVKFPNWLERMD
ncbi:hypothetical protein ABW21_db0201910 [Orbilia brochopaga]|nr:hypothetical protein ABW21_db0201910 [Drechslerella brochopaga]